MNLQWALAVSTEFASRTYVFPLECLGPEICLPARKMNVGAHI
jgi:hypothetical protein